MVCSVVAFNMSISIIRFLLAAVVVSLVVSCSRAPDLVGIDNALHPVQSTPSVTKRKVFIATTREATEVAGAFYSRTRAPDIGYASVVVSIPPNHMSGEIERAKKLPPDPLTEFAVVDPTVYGSGQVFINRLNVELAKLPPKDRKVLFFVHGYNNTISDSILRIAQFAEDTDFNGVPVLFSWASAAKVSHYVYDLNSALVARPKMLEVASLLASSNATGFDLFAHSMGSLLTVEALVQASLSGQMNNVGRLDNLMLAAPDIDLDLFKSQLSQMNIRDQSLFVFVSADDKALGFSRRISGGVQRVGSANAAELADLGVTVIDLSQIEDSSSGTHSKFAGSPEVVQLIGKSLKQNNYAKPRHQPTLTEFLGGVPISIALN